MSTGDGTDSSARLGLLHNALAAMFFQKFGDRALAMPDGIVERSVAPAIGRIRSGGMSSKTWYGELLYRYVATEWRRRPPRR